MNDIQFKELYNSIHKDESQVDPWFERLLECQEIVKKLWQTEFKDEIGDDKRIFVTITSSSEIKNGALASIAESITTPGKFIIRVNKRLWEITWAARLKEILRHEMLHISTGLGHEDLEWDAIAEERRVFPWDNIWDY